VVSPESISMACPGRFLQHNALLPIFLNCAPAVAALCLLMLPCLSSHAQAVTPIRIDASQPYAQPDPAPYDGGSPTSPSGSTIAVNSRYLTRDGKPWLPVMGEFHFSRYPQSQWEEELLKMKAAGVEIVAAYVIWIHHEEIEGQFDWQGQRNLRAFAQLCARHGMYLEPRIGPWDHAEVRNGGFPDWLLKQGPTRVNNPAYLAHVSAWYGQIAQQLQGLLWKDGGPVIGIQLENEYSLRGPGAGEEHILALKKLALQSGLDVPLYLVTGWDNAAVPPRAVIPVYGGYPDAPWDASLTMLPPAEVYTFRFHSRVTANMGAMGAASPTSPPPSASPDLPYLTAEVGAGIQDTYHRRPVIQPDDIAAIYPVILGSGANLYGTYMFQGGENPEGKLSTLQESQATGYPNDLPVKSYDFQAPLGEFGDERTAFRKMKVFQYFLNDFGDLLAPMLVHSPDRQPANPQDLSVPRASVRSHEDSGFIFLNNYVRNYSMPARPAAQFQIRLPGLTLQVPSHPVDIPSGAYFIWPFNLRSAGVTLRYSTAQVFTRIDNGAETTLYFIAIPGIQPEFALDSNTLRHVETSSGKTTRDSALTIVSGVKPGVDSFIDLTASDGRKTRLVLLTEQEAENAWKLRLDPTAGPHAQYDHLLITPQDFFSDPDATPDRIWLRSRATPRFHFTITPPTALSFSSTLPLTRTAVTAQSATFLAQAQPRLPVLQVASIRPASAAPPVTLGPAPSWRPTGVAQAPTDTAFNRAAKWKITLPLQPLNGLSELYLQVDYQGDIARLSANSKLLVDNFYNGQPWSIGLARFLHPGVNSFDLTILPLRKDAPIYLELGQHPAFTPAGQLDRLDRVQLVPEYQLILNPTADNSR